MATHKQGLKCQTVPSTIMRYQGHHQTAISVGCFFSISVAVQPPFIPILYHSVPVCSSEVECFLLCNRVFTASFFICQTMATVLARCGRLFFFPKAKPHRNYEDLWEFTKTYASQLTTVPERYFPSGTVGVFTSRSTARVILRQVLSMATCGTRTHRGDSL